MRAFLGVKVMYLARERPLSVGASRSRDTGNGGMPAAARKWPRGEAGAGERPPWLTLMTTVTVVALVATAGCAAVWGLLLASEAQVRRSWSLSANSSTRDAHAIQCVPGAPDSPARSPLLLRECCVAPAGTHNHGVRERSDRPFRRGGRCACRAVCQRLRCTQAQLSTLFLDTTGSSCAQVRLRNHCVRPQMHALESAPAGDLPPGMVTKAVSAQLIQLIRP